MFVPSNNGRAMIYRCKSCAKLKVHHSNYSAGFVCDECNEKSEMESDMKSETVNEIDGLEDINLILDTYYKRNIKISFSHNGNKIDYYYTAVMIPNTKEWWDKKIEDSKMEMAKAGLKDISFKMLDKFYKMEDYEVTSYMNDSPLKMHYSYNPNKFVQMPMILKYYAKGQGSVNKINWLKIVGITLFIFSLLVTAFAIFMFVYFMYNKIWIGITLIIMIYISGKQTFEMYKTLTE